MAFLENTIVTGVLATLTMDAWGILRRPLLGWPVADYRLIGRWVAHLFRGTFRHEAIGRAAPVPGESTLGWVIHYATGLAFAAAMFAIAGDDWAHAPTLAPALAFGLATVLFPFLVMQPAMGLGIAASRTPRPATARLQSLLTHAVFGAGLHLGALVAARL